MAVLDIWGVIMGMAGWEEGRPLVGSREVERSEVLEGLFVDGEWGACLRVMLLFRSITDGWEFFTRTTFPSDGVQSAVRVHDGADSSRVARSGPDHFAVCVSHLDCCSTVEGRAAVEEDGVFFVCIAGVYEIGV